VLTVSPARAAVGFSKDFEALPAGVAWRDGGAYGGWQACKPTAARCCRLYAEDAQARYDAITVTSPVS
jgi:hypothetical protein